MSFYLRFSRAAQAEFTEAVQWYEEKRRGLGAQFVLYVESKLEAVRKSPENYPFVYSHYQRAILKRFPYSIFFEVVGSGVHILAIYHTSRKPDIWVTRSSNDES